MNIIYALLLILLGILAAPSLLLSKSPNSKEILDRITPYQGWIGVVFCIWGIWGIISSILNIGWLTSAPIFWILYLLVAVVEAVLGFLLGYSLIQHYALSKNPEANEKGAELLNKLRPLQGKFGMAAIVIGILFLVVGFIYHV